jgi:hypothetical protein
VLNALGERLQRDLGRRRWRVLRQAFLELLEFEIQRVLALDQFVQRQQISLVSIQQPLPLLLEQALAPHFPLADRWHRLQGGPGVADPLRLPQQVN